MIYLLTLGIMPLVISGVSAFVAYHAATRVKAIEYAPWWTLFGWTLLLAVGFFIGACFVFSVLLL